MDKEALRKQLYEELHSQFEVKLRESKRQKSQIEEELESASEKWRSERRRLNSEIDRLESALAEARDARRKASDSKGKPAVDPQEIARLQAAAEEKLQQAAAEWETERGKLQTEISRLQNGVAELLERSNNPLRAGLAAKEQLENRLDEALRMKRQAEDDLLAAKAEWDQEKVKLAGEMVRLRRTAGLKTKEKLPEEIRAEELEKELASTVRAKQALENDLAKVRQETSGLKDAQAADLKRIGSEVEGARAEAQKLERQLADSKDSATRERAAELEKYRKEATRNQEQATRDLEKARQEATRLQEGHAEEIRKVTGLLEESRREIQRLDRQLQDTVGSTAKERAETQESQKKETARVREEMERAQGGARQEVGKLKETHAAELQRMTDLFDEAKVHILGLERQLKESAGSADKQHAEELEKQRKEIARLREEAGNSSSPGKEEIAKLRETHAADLYNMTVLFEEARGQVQVLERQLKEARGSGSKDQGNKEQTAELERLTTQLQESRSEIQQLERRLAETKDSVSSDVVEQLRRQYDERLQDMIRQKTQLSDDLKNASSQLEAERSRFAAAAAAAAQSKPEKSDKKEKGKGSAAAIDASAIDAELARVEESIAGIARLIDDPATDLSIVIRKNVERAELAAYLKGILFSIGRSRGL